MKKKDNRFTRWTRYFVGGLVMVLGFIGFLIPILPGGFLLFFVGLHILKPSLSRKCFAFMKVIKHKTIYAIKKLMRLTFKILRKIFQDDKDYR